MTNDNKQVMKGSILIFLAIKPKVFPEVFKEISPVVTRNHLVASIAAGGTLDYIQKSPGYPAEVASSVNMTILTILFKFYDLINSIYSNTKCSIKCGNQRTEYFNYCKGVRQGCILSPMLFNLYLNEIPSLFG